MRNKKLVYLVLFCLIAFSFIANAQTTQKVNYKVTHNWVKKISAVDYISEATRSKYEYVWGNRAEYSSNSVLYFNEKSSLFEDSIDQSEWASKGYSYREDEYQIYRDIENKRTYDLMRTLNKLFVIDDSTYNENWKVLNNIREIAGHICMSAQYNDELTGNKVIAWFALDLPYPIGPERYGGLPGIILEININDGAKVISAESIEELTKYTIEKPTHKKRVKKITEEEYQALIREHVEEKKKAEEPYFRGIRY